jgi:cyclophilin family peptidyl-prolyl cis-trans isomerase/FKBP-type peptidyl-prolyl cis-trans isomerase 2
MKRYFVPLLVAVALLVGGCGGEATVTSTPTHTPAPMPTRAPGEPPPMIIDQSRQYTAIIETEEGNLTLELFAADVPVTVNNFIFLAREGFYDGITFHRVIAGFMAQGGDPTGTGAGGPGYTFPDEFSQHTHDAGALSMANSGPDTNGSQFFITYAPQHGLDERHSVFGRLIKGMDVLENLTPRDPRQSPDYTGDAIIRVTIEEAVKTQAEVGDTVRVHYTGRLGNGTEFDSSLEREPLQFTIGLGQMISGFEQAAIGMSPGEWRTVTIPADEAYGPYDEDLVTVVDRNELPPGQDPVVGQRFQGQTPDGLISIYTVIDVSESTVTLDGNHPLAGKDLTFDIQLVEIL